jgi:hypothetical protein
MTWIKRAGRLGIAGRVTAMALACGGSGDDNVPTGSTGSIQVTVNPATLSIPHGGNGTVTVTDAYGGL